MIKTNEDYNYYVKTIENIVAWCASHYLELNVKKLKKLFFFYFRRLDNSDNTVVISSEPAEIVEEYKYLGVVFDEKKYLA